MAGLRSVHLFLVLLCACAPALDWRQVRPAGLELEAVFPCRPSSLTRDVQLLDKQLPMQMHACASGGSTFAVGSLLLPDVRDVGPALASLRDAAARNVGGDISAPAALQVAGMTPNPQAARYRLSGRRPDGSAVIEHLVVFARGPRVYQALVVGDKPADDAVTTFFSGLRAGL